MKRSVMWSAGLAAVGSLGIAAGVALSQPEGGGMKMDKKSIAKMMEQMGGPAEEHAFLEPLIGEFESEISMTMGPGMPPMTAKATGSTKWLFGKRFVQTTTAPAADEDLKIETMSLFGFDKRTKKFFWIGIDSTDTYAVFAQGGYDKDTKTFTLLGENEEPGMGKMPFKNVLKVEDADHVIMQLWFQMKGAPGADADGWFKVMEMKRTRKKG